jgi:hypothetical protein
MLQQGQILLKIHSNAERCVSLLEGADNTGDISEEEGEEGDAIDAAEESQRLQNITGK